MGNKQKTRTKCQCIEKNYINCNQPVWIGQCHYHTVFLSAFEFNLPLPFASVHAVSVGSLLTSGGWGGGVHVYPCACLCLFLSSWCFFIKVLFGPTWVSSNSKLLATLLFTAITRAAVSMIRNSYNAPNLATKSLSFTGPVRMCQKHKQYLKFIYLVCLLFLIMEE